MNIIEGDTYVRGNLRTDGFAVPANSIGNTQFNSSDPLATDKQKHQYVAVYSQKHGADVAAERKTVHVAHAAGTLAFVYAGMVVPSTGDSTVTVDVLKNGVSVMSGTITLTNAHAAFALVLGTISAGVYTSGSVFEVSVTVSAGTGNVGEGVFARLVFREEAGA